MVNIYRIHIVKNFNANIGVMSRAKIVDFENRDKKSEVLNIQQKCSYFHWFQGYING